MIHFLAQPGSNLIAFLIALLLTTSFPFPSPGRAHGSEQTCLRTCGSGKSRLVVQYPFGFSPACPIQLNCSSSKAIRIGKLDVIHITSSGIWVKLPTQCNRSIDSISPLFGNNYAPSRSNSLLLQKCSRSFNSCSIASQLGVDDCGFGEQNVSCHPLLQKQSLADVASYENVTSTQCKVLVSSFASNNDDNQKSFVFEKLLLSWWLEGGCTPNGCSKDATCNPVQLSDGGTGHQCKCKSGFTGDGFVAGQGCHRASDCSAARYMNGKCGGKSRVAALVGGLIGGASLTVLIIVGCYICRQRSSSLRSKLSAKRLISEAAGTSSVPLFLYKEIEKATNGFSEKQRLGTGAYGTVYAGKLISDKLVAIKRIRRKDTDSIEQFMNEIKLLSSVHHPNLVRLLGCCIEDDEQILVYEFMPNGTLCQHLQKERGNGIPWAVRLTIAAETANAITYLHSAINPPIYHRDIKSSNILLDFNFKSKVADFGLSRLGMAELSHISTAPQGTPGYLDPQYHQYFHLSDKSDVYSFGVVLVEIITGLKAVDFTRIHSEVNLAALAVDRIGRGCVDEIIDPNIEPYRDAWTLSSIHSVAELAFRCLASHRDMRPTMMEVAEELEQIRLSAYLPSAYQASSTSSFGSENSISVSSIRSSGVYRKKMDNLALLEEVSLSPPKSGTEQSSPSTTKISINIIR